MPGIDEPIEPAELETQVLALTDMSLSGLRAVWRRNWGPPPRMRSAKLLRLMIAWRIQAAAEGGLDAKLKRQIRSGRMPRRPLPPAGTRLTREYKGVPFTVVVGEGEVVYSGRSYRSLSEVAREITGTRWNGPRFFGLRPGASL